MFGINILEQPEGDTGEPLPDKETEAKAFIPFESVMPSMEAYYNNLKDHSQCQDQ